MRRVTRGWIGAPATIAMVVALGAAAAADERKQLAFDIVDRNVQQMTDISDSLFLFW